MARLQLNGLLGTVGNNPITLSATGNTCSWVSAPAFPLIAAPDYAVVIAEPDTTNEEIFYLIGFTPGGTTGLVQRAAEASQSGRALNSPIAHTSVAWVHGPTGIFDFSRAASRIFAAQTFG